MAYRVSGLFTNGKRNCQKIQRKVGLLPPFGLLQFVSPFHWILPRKRLVFNSNRLKMRFSFDSRSWNIKYTLIYTLISGIFYCATSIMALIVGHSQVKYMFQSLSDDRVFSLCYSGYKCADLIQESGFLDAIPHLMVST